MSDPTTDPDQLAVYDAQELMLGCLDRPGGSQRVTLDGRDFFPEMEPRFSAPDDVERYVARVITHLQENHCDYGGREQTIPGVRARKGSRSAHYEPLFAVIAVPTYEVGGEWALRGLVVLHELAHHLAGVAGHGLEFRTTLLRLLEDIGCPELAKLLLHTFETANLTTIPFDVANETLAKMSQILRQAENTDYESERELFMGRAQELATRHQIALAVLRGRSDGADREDAPQGQTLIVGKRGTKGLNRYVRLLAHIRQVNNLEMTVAHDSTRVTLFGFAADIKMARALYASVSVQMTSAWQRYFAEHPVERYGRRVPTITRRLEFFSAFVETVGARLQEARRRVLEEAVAGSGGTEPAARSGEAVGATGLCSSGGSTFGGSLPGTSGPGTTASSAALALRDRALEVSDAFAEHIRRNNVRGTWRGWQRSAAVGMHAPGAARAGFTAGSQASLGGENSLSSS